MKRNASSFETSRPLAVKVMYLLTDVTEPDSGNFTIFPGSHLRPFPERAERILKEGYRFLMCAPVRSYGHLDKARTLAGRT